MSKIGEIRESKSFGKYKLVGFVEQEGKKCYEIEFVNTGYRKIVQSKEFYSGSIKDQLLPTVRGVGYCSDPDVPKSYIKNGKKSNTPSYETWLGILKRCYSEGSKSYVNYGGRGVRTCEEWKDFAVFHKWFTENYIEGCVLDKDIMTEGYRGMVYSPENCRFVPPVINGFFTNSRSARGLYPVGVHQIVTQKGLIRYKVQVGDLVSRQIQVGQFMTLHEAFCAYKEVREAQAKQLAEQHYSLGNITHDVYLRLMTWDAIPYP